MNDLEQFDQDARHLWISPQANPDFPVVELARLERAESRFMQAIRRRDALETGAAGLIVACLLPALWFAARRNDWWLTAALAWGILYGIGVIVRLWSARSKRSADPTLPLHEYRLQIVARVDAQIALLGSVRWWYVSPVVIFCALICVAVWQSAPIKVRPRLLLGLSVQFILTAALGWFIVKLNEGRGLQSLREERARLLGSGDVSRE